MKSNTIKLLIAGFAVLAALPDVALAQSQPVKEDYRERYGILSEQNMFLKDRRPRRRESSAGNGPSRQEAPRAPELSYLLTGVVFEEGEFRAYIENLREPGVLRLRVGDPVARGVISQIQIDAIEYSTPDHRAWIDLGRDLTGGYASVPSRTFGSAEASRTTTPPSAGTPVAGTPAAGTPVAAGEAGATTQPAAAVGGTPLPNPDDPNLSMADRMKLRRQQEMNKR